MNKIGKFGLQSKISAENNKKKNIETYYKKYTVVEDQATNNMKNYSTKINNKTNIQIIISQFIWKQQEKL